MSNSGKSIRSNTSKTSKEHTPVNIETPFGFSVNTPPETLSGMLKPSLPADTTLARLIERIKQL